MRLLLTGASGFIGKNFLELAPKNMEIIGIYNSSKDIEQFVKEKKLGNVRLYKCDLRKKEEIEALFKRIGNDFEYCIYLAGNVNVPLSITNPIEDLSITAIALVNFLQSCSKIKRFIYMSTAGVYDGIKGPVTANSKLNPTVPYCISKLTAEQYVKFFSSIGKIEQYVILRFGGAFGKYSKKSKFMAKLVEDICLKSKKTIEIYGDGSNIINVMYAKDAIKALLKCLSSKVSNTTCNLGQGNMTITETVQRVAKAFNKNVEIGYAPRIKEQKYITFEIKEDFNDIFNFKPDYSFEKGVKEFGQLMKNET
ncbi:NAD-dependent epimerase/dehydratase family protein [Candidatus Woesearchaeota archaeon]|nr:NAD-dependent epimerase/dehydratase family protein [Candidatus Woesearchaeota archaeon]